MSLVCGGVVGAGVVDGVLDGVLLGLLVVGGCSLMLPVDEVLPTLPELLLAPVEELLPGLPETLPVLLLVVLFEDDALGADVVEPVVWPAIPPEVLLALDPLLATVSSSFTFFTPGTDFASFFASFLSLLFGTVPLNETVPCSTLICTFCRSGLVASCS